MNAKPVATQSRHPWRATLRTIFQVGIGLASLAPTVIAVGGLPTNNVVVTQIVLVSAAVTRIMAIPGVNDFLRKVAPWLAADPAKPQP